jgi:hypothetical protein
MSSPPTAQDLTRRDISTDVDDQLVRRGLNLGAKIRKAFDKVKTGFQNAGKAIAHVATKVVDKVKTGFQTAGKAIAHVATKAVQKIKTGVTKAVKKVGNFVRTTGAKIVKFGAKVLETGAEVVGHIAGFIPEIGKPIQEAIHGVAKVAGAVADHVKANLGKKLQRGFDIMNTANTVMGYIPLRREFLEEEAFQRDFMDSEEEAYYQRDSMDPYSSYFEERDDMELDNREDSYFELYERDIYDGYDLEY